MLKEYKIEEKICRGCHGYFDCKAGDIVNCRCFGISLNNETISFIKENYMDCLCNNCLTALNTKQAQHGFLHGGTQ